MSGNNITFSIHLSEKSIEDGTNISFQISINGSRKVDFDSSSIAVESGGEVKQKDFNNNLTTIRPNIQTNQANQTTQTDQTDQIVQTDEINKTNRNFETNNILEKDKIVQTDETVQTDKNLQTDQIVNPCEAVQTDKTVQVNQIIQTDEAYTINDVFSRQYGENQPIRSFSKNGKENFVKLPHPSSLFDMSLTRIIEEEEEEEECSMEIGRNNRNVEKNDRDSVRLLEKTTEQLYHVHLESNDDNSEVVTLDDDLVDKLIDIINDVEAQQKNRKAMPTTGKLLQSSSSRSPH